MRKELKTLFKDDVSPDEIIRVRVDCPFSKGRYDPHYVDLTTKQNQILVIKSTCDDIDQEIAQSADALQGHTCKSLKDIVVENTEAKKAYYDATRIFDKKVRDVTSFLATDPLKRTLEGTRTIDLNEVDSRITATYEQSHITNRLNLDTKLNALAALASDFDFEDINIYATWNDFGTVKTNQWEPPAAPTGKIYNLTLSIKHYTLATRVGTGEWEITYLAKNRLKNIDLQGHWENRCSLCKKTVKNLKQHCTTEMHTRNFNFNILRITKLLGRVDKPINYKLIRKKNPDLNIAAAVRELCNNAKLNLSQ